MTINIKEARKIHAAATKGPWEFHPENGECVRVTARRDGWVEECQPVDIVRVPIEWSDDVIFEDESNLAFIANAHNIMPELLDELERMRAELKSIATCPNMMQAALKCEGHVHMPGVFS